MTNILVIEDDELLRDIYATKLRLEGFMVDTAQDGAEGLQIAISSAPDIILLDMIMPRMNGLEFLEAYRPMSRSPRVVTVVMSNKSSSSEINRAKTLGAFDYLIKARYTPDDITTRIRSYLS